MSDPKLAEQGPSEEQVAKYTAELMGSQSRFPIFEAMAASPSAFDWHLHFGYVAQLVWQYVEFRCRDFEYAAVLKQVNKWRLDVIECIRKAKGKDFVKVYGTSSDPVWKRKPILQEFINHLAKLLVDNGYWVGTGGANVGAMGGTNRAVKEAAAWVAEQRGLKRAVEALVAVYLRVRKSKVTYPVDLLPEGRDYAALQTYIQRVIDAETNEGREPMFKGVDLGGPPLWSLFIRTPLLNSLGDTYGHIFFPGGKGTNEEATHVDIGYQLKDVILTANSHNGSGSWVAPMIFISPKMILANGNKQETRFWAGLEMLYENMKELGTFGPDGMDHMRFIDPDESGAIETAEEVFELIDCVRSKVKGVKV